MEKRTILAALVLALENEYTRREQENTSRPFRLATAFNVQLLHPRLVLKADQPNRPRPSRRTFLAGSRAAIVSRWTSTLADESAGSSTFMSPGHRDFRAPAAFRPWNAPASEDRSKDTSQEAPPSVFLASYVHRIQTCFCRGRSLIIRL